ncbi:MAG: amino acid adenylation domain-containing protein [Anaerolineales bacterium]|nr:amino acid adenylation domain-containing protein [Anaerolineales bacterium]
MDKTFCVHQLFERQVEHNPQKTAMIFGGHTLSYRELNARANRLARLLRQRGVGQEALVGISLAPSFEMVISVWAVLKAGGAYVPLDPAYPRERLAFMVQDAGLHLLITQSAYLPELQTLGIPLVCLDCDLGETQGESEANLPVLAEPDNLAYVIYTSGSTGQPKGVMVTHASLACNIRTNQEALGIQSDTVYLLSASLTYAVSLRQIFTTLCSGGALVIASKQHILDPRMLFELIQQAGVTQMDFVPAYFRMCIQAFSGLDEKERRELLSNQVRTIILVGEPLTSDLPSIWMNQFAHPAQLINLFGQTETTGIVATFRIPAGYNPPSGVIPIGRQVPSARLYVLNAELKPVLPGETGELFISTPSLARGYLNHPGQTAEKFIPNPFRPQSGERLHRTGDLCRVLNDGNIIHLGRIDQQVKVRGMRVDLIEIEVSLRRYPAVRDAVVFVSEASPFENFSSTQELVACIEPEQGSPVDPSALREFLQRKLAEHMLPSMYIVLDALPRLPNSKVDRRVVQNWLHGGARVTQGITQSSPSRLSGLPRPPKVKQPDLRDWLYTPVWKPAAARSSFGESGRKDLPGQGAPPLLWMVFNHTQASSSEDGPSQCLVKHLAEAGEAVISIHPGKEYAWQSDHNVTIRPDQPADYRAVLNSLAAQGRFSSRTPLRILHFGSLDALTSAGGLNGRIGRAIQMGAGSLILLLQALDENRMTGDIRLGVITSHAQEVLGGDLIHPEQAIIFGLCQVIPLEFPNLSCFCIDIDQPLPGERLAAEMVDQIIDDLSDLESEPRTNLTADLSPGAQHQNMLAYRGTARYYLEMERAMPAKPGRNRSLDESGIIPRFRHQGVYLITGGLGGVGLETAEYLAKTVQAGLVLVGRSAFPDRQQWQDWLESHPEDDPLSHKIRKLQAIEGIGGQVLLLSADISDRVQVERVLIETVKAFGGLDGIIHAAGVRGVQGSIYHLDIESFRAVLSPKVWGALYLDEACRSFEDQRGRKLDFVLYFSSVSSILGLIGYAAYSAANSFLDAFAHWKRQKGGMFQSVNWDTWQEVGMAVDALAESRVNWVPEDYWAGAILPIEGQSVFGQLLNYDLPQVIVSPVDLLEQIAERNVLIHTGQKILTARSLQTGLVSGDDIENNLIRIWKHLLRRDVIDRDDNFYDLGGHSLLVAMLFTQIEAEFGQRLPLTTLYQAPTPRLLANTLRSDPSQPSSSRLSLMMPGDSSPPFFFIHTINTDLIEYAHLVKALGANGQNRRAFYGLLPRGLDDGDAPHTSIPEMAAEYIQAIRHVQPNGPYHLIGFCFAGVIAHEMACQLTASGEEVGLLINIEGYPPRNSLPLKAYFSLRGVTIFIRNFPEWLMDFSSISISDRIKGDLKEIRLRAKHFANKLGVKTYITPEETIDAQRLKALPAHVLKVKLALLQALIDYRPPLYPGCMILIRGRGLSMFRGLDPQLGWGLFVSGGVEVYHFKTDHNELMLPPNVDGLAELLNSFG